MIIGPFRRQLRRRGFAHHYRGDEADSLRKQHVPGRRPRIAGRVNEPGDDQLRGAAEAGDGDGIDRGEGAAKAARYWPCATRNQECGLRSGDHGSGKGSSGRVFVGL